MASSNPFSIALTGDVMLSRRLSAVRSDGFARLAATLAAADTVCGNFEATCHAFEPDVTANITAGTPMVTPPGLLGELHELGFRMFATANNHAFDYGERGVVRTVEHLGRAGFVTAGTGAHRKDARRPRYLEVAGRRVALVAVTATFRPWNAAGPQGQDMGGRPGVATLASTPLYHAEPEAFAVVQRYAEDVGLVDELRRKKAFGFYTDRELGLGAAEELPLGGVTFTRAERNDVDHRVDEDDLAALRQAVSEAAGQADLVLASLHYHDMDVVAGKGSAKRSGVKEPARYVRRTARALVDAGADVVFGHGPHMPLGVELHGGKPIFLSLGNFLFQNDTADRVPLQAYERFGLGSGALPGEFFEARSGGGTRAHGGDPAFWTGIVPTCHFDGDELHRVDLTVVDLGRRAPSWADRGVPTVADPATAEKVVAELRALSGPDVEALLKTDV